MSRFEAWFHHAATLLVGGTGLIYAWFRYAAEPSDPFALVHPAQPAWQHAHVVTAPLLVFAIGMIWRAHAWLGLRLGTRRRASGIGLLATAAPMVLSGVLLQVSVEPVWRRAWVAVHLAASALWLGGYLAHQLRSRRPSRSAP